MISMQFGLSNAVPPTAEAAWGARWIFPDDHVFDRVGWHGERDSEASKKLLRWLNDEGAFKKARTAAAKLAKNYKLEGSEHRQVTLYEDEKGIVVGNPQASFGYLYVAGWLK